MKKAVLTLVFLSLAIMNYAQESTYKAKDYEMTSIGIGLGLDNGGIGVNATAYLQKNIALFAGLGYNFYEASYNVGTKLRLLSKDNRITPFAMAMYGYNAVIIITNEKDLSKTFFGTSIGAGVDIRNKKKTNIWSFGLIIPFRTTEVKNYMQHLRENNGVEFNGPLPPFALSVSLRFWIN